LREKLGLRFERRIICVKNREKQRKKKRNKSKPKANTQNRKIQCPRMLSV